MFDTNTHLNRNWIVNRFSLIKKTIIILKKGPIFIRIKIIKAVSGTLLNSHSSRHFKLLKFTVVSLSFRVLCVVGWIVRQLPEFTNKKTGLERNGLLMAQRFQIKSKNCCRIVLQDSGYSGSFHWHSLAPDFIDLNEYQCFSFTIEIALNSISQLFFTLIIWNTNPLFFLNIRFGVIFSKLEFAKNETFIARYWNKFKEVSTSFKND